MLLDRNIKLFFYYYLTQIIQPQAGGGELCPPPHSSLNCDLITDIISLRLTLEKGSCHPYGSQVAAGLHWEVGSVGRG